MMFWSWQTGEWLLFIVKLYLVVHLPLPTDSEAVLKATYLYYRVNITCTLDLVQFLLVSIHSCTATPPESPIIDQLTHLCHSHVDFDNHCPAISMARTKVSAKSNANPGRERKTPAKLAPKTRREQPKRVSNVFPHTTSFTDVSLA
jgi:hypothetical protein